MDMKKIMEQAKKMQSMMEKQEIELKSKIFSVEKQGILIKANGNREILEININEVLIDPEDKEMLQDIIIIATNEILENINDEYEKISPKNQQGMPF
ncbi:MAG: YbaB/EbfC family nucleoid-associated protein [Mycoplasmataceae bacterium]|nr:YbaB/EbfC family nucleoid-associated protein [Mycoplasmataceae bacterium]